MMCGRGWVDVGQSGYLRVASQTDGEGDDVVIGPTLRLRPLSQGAGLTPRLDRKDFSPRDDTEREDCQWRTTTGRRMPVVPFVAGVLSIWVSTVEERPGD